jgi:hypothetical protein
MKPWPADNIDPIEELARIINEAQERGTGLTDLALSRAASVLIPSGAPGAEPQRARRS